MENGHRSRIHRLSDCLPPVSDYIHAIKAADSLSTQCSEIVEHFSLDITVTPKVVVKEVEELSHQLCMFQSFARTIGTCSDSSQLRREMFKCRQKACDAILSTTAQLSSSFKRCPNLPKKEIGDLERSCKVLVGCLHALDRELRRTFHLYHLFPLYPDTDGLKQPCLIKVGFTATPEVVNKNELVFPSCTPSEKYLKERESWQDLENDILKVHELDIELHRNETLGPVLDYLTLCPMGDIPGSQISLDDTSDLPDGYCDEETLFRKKSNLCCYMASILVVFCVGGGLLLGFIFMMVH